MTTLNPEHKIGDWEYPYRVWPEDFPYKGIFTQEFISEQIEKHNFPNIAEFREIFALALERSASFYYGDFYYKGATSLSHKEIASELRNLSKRAHQLYEYISNLPIELFEELVELVGPRKEWDEIYQVEDRSHYGQCRINQEIDLPLPPIEVFYKNHPGYKTFNIFIARLKEDLLFLSDLCKDKKGDVEWEFQRNKAKGPQRKAFDDFVYRMTLFWEYFSGNTASRSKKIDTDVQGVCLDFLDDIFAIINQHYINSIDPTHKPLRRQQLDAKLAQYIKNEEGKRNNRLNNKEILKEIKSAFQLYNIPAILER